MPECIYGKPVTFFAPENDENPEEFGVYRCCIFFVQPFWWERVDSNHRSKDATDLQSVPFGHSGTLPYYYIKKKWSWWTDLNPRPADYKSAALPTELHQLIYFVHRVSRECLYNILHKNEFVKCFFEFF